MSATDDTPALNPDGTLKDAHELEFIHSPSHEMKDLPETEDPNHAESDSPENADAPAPSKKVKSKAAPVTTRVASKRVVKASEKLAKVSEHLESTRLSPGTARFVQRTITVGQGTVSTGPSASSSAAPKKSTSSATSTKKTSGSNSSDGRKRKSGTSARVPAAKRVRVEEADKGDEESEGSEDEEEEDHGDIDGEGSEDEASEDQEDDAEERYKELKAKTASKPRRIHNHRGQDPRTKDLRAVYDKAVDSENRKGHRCHVCKEFFTGGNSSLRAHIARFWDEHGQYYLQKCKELDIEPNSSCLPAKGTQQAPPTAVQTTLGAFGVEHIPRWSKDGLLDHIVEFVVTDDQAFSVVDKSSFRALLKYQKPSMKDSDIPHRTKVKEEVVHKAEVAIHQIVQHFKDIPSKISITLDAWTSDSYDPYLGITAHYIESPRDQPCEWTLKKQVIGFEELKGRHNGENMADVTNNVLEKFEIRDKFGWATADNATACDTTVRKMHRKDDKWKPRDRRIRCMEHTINLAAGDFIKALGPLTAWNNASDDDIAHTDVPDEDDEDSVTDVLDFDAGDVLGKGLALVNQIRASPQAKAFFRECCREEKVKELELIKWVRTRWGSMHDLIERLVLLRKALIRFCCYADEHLPKLKNKQYSDFTIDAAEWKTLELILEVLAEPRKAQASFSSETESTVWKIIPTLDCLRDKWDMFSRLSKFSSIHSAICAGLDKLNKWYTEIGKCEVYYICLVLHPGMKEVYPKAVWDYDLYTRGSKALQRVFDSYYVRPKRAGAQSKDNASGLVSQAYTGYSSDWIKAKIAQSAPEVTSTNPSNPRKELDDYLKAPVETSVADPIKWWGYHSSQYPTLARIARDYLAIQGSSVASERAFSSAGITDDVRRNCIDPKTFGYVQILKAAYKSKAISTVDEANSHEHQEVVVIE